MAKETTNAFSQEMIVDMTSLLSQLRFYLFFNSYLQRIYSFSKTNILLSLCPVISTYINKLKIKIERISCDKKQCITNIVHNALRPSLNTILLLISFTYLHSVSVI